jgi:hypothetical protein
MTDDEDDRQLTYAELRTAVATYLRLAADNVERTPADELNDLIERIGDSFAHFRRKSH